MTLSDEDLWLLNKLAAMKADKQYMEKLKWVNRNEPESAEEIINILGGILFCAETEEEKVFSAKVRAIMLAKRNAAGVENQENEGPTQVNSQE